MMTPTEQPEFQEDEAMATPGRSVLSTRSVEIIEGAAVGAAACVALATLLSITAPALSPIAIPFSPIVGALGGIIVKELIRRGKGRHAGMDSEDRLGLSEMYHGAQEIPASDKVIDLVAFDIRRAADRDYSEEFLSSYFSKLVQYVNMAKEEILVLDYLAHHRSLGRINSEEEFGIIRGKEELRRRYKKYFRAIEEQVSIHSTISYTRILQLPLGSVGTLSRSALIDRCVDLMFVETVEHIKRMHEDRPCDFYLYILPVPLRPYSYMIIDKTVLLSEYDRYNKSAFSFPDHLIVDRADSGNRRQDQNVRALITHHSRQVKAVLATKEPVSAEEIEKAVLNLEFKKWDRENQASTPEEREEKRRDIEMKRAIYSPNPGPQADG